MVRRLTPDTPALLSFRGPDAVRYLNGQLTQEVSGLGERTLPSCVTDAKGRLQFLVSVFQGPEDGQWLVAGDPDRADALLARLERYLIADEVEIENLTGCWTRVHADGPLPDPVFTRTAAGPFGQGLDHWFPAAGVPPGEVPDDEEAEALRIAAGLPRWGYELEEGMLPPEAGLDRHAISYHKGCYIGQEVLSRIKSVGRVNRRLARFTTQAESPGPLFSAGLEVGRLTSIAPLAAVDGSRAALGYLGKKGFSVAHFELPDGGKVDFLDWAAPETSIF